MAEITTQVIDEILAYIPYFADPNSKFTENPKTDDGSEPLSPRCSRKLIQFMETACLNGFMIPFDWCDWRKTAEELFNNPAVLAKADLETLRKLLTTHLRQERFCDGHMLSMIECGHILAILKRLAELRKEMDAT
jgi:hypothetical protein